jgi:hypothetical protein
MVGEGMTIGTIGPRTEADRGIADRRKTRRQRLRDQAIEGGRQ